MHRLPAFSALWFPAACSPGENLRAVECELFDTAKEALAWARGMVVDRGGGAISLSGTAEDQLVLGTFGNLPPSIERDVREILRRTPSRAKPE